MTESWKKLVRCVALMAMSLGLLVGCSQKKTTAPQKKETPAPTFSLSDFASALACAGCHPDQYNEWRGSIHAYAFLDPVNTVFMEGLRETVGVEELGHFCVECHSPVGMLTGETPAGFDKANVDPIVKEGLICDACHLMEKASPTAVGHAEYHYDVKSGTRYASITDPAPNAFHKSAAKPFFSQSRACLPCHDLINDSGLPAEITFTEWQESPYGAMGMECQACHMETYAGQAAVGGPQRDNLHRHDFIGVDIALIDGFPNIEEQRRKVGALLENSVSLTVDCLDTVAAGATLDIQATVTNDKTGHDIPSSVTFVRQMWLEVTVTSGADTLYKSGYFDANGDLMDSHSDLSPNGDPDLALFQSALFRDGQPADVFTANQIEIGSIAPFESKSGNYSVLLPALLGQTVELKVRLRFRPLPPYSIRDSAPELIEKIPVFEMEAFEKTIHVRG